MGFREIRELAKWVRQSPALLNKVKGLLKFALDDESLEESLKILENRCLTEFKEEDERLDMLARISSYRD